MHQHEEFWRLVKQEFFRKIIHMSSIATIFVANYSEVFLVWALAIITLLYIFSEAVRLSLGNNWFISKVVVFTLRPNEKDRLALGPVTLSLGIMSAFMFFPPVAARIAVAALAFGDGVASLVGRLFGRIRPKVLLGKSLEGSLSCLLVVFYTTSIFSTGQLMLSLFVALLTVFVEILPLKSFDNIAIPLCVGFMGYKFGY